MAAMPLGGAQAVEPPTVPAIEAAPRTGDGDADVDGRDYIIWRKTLGAGVSPVAGIGGGDLNDWQSNYGAGGAAAAIGGGIDILIANTGGDRVVDLALQCFTSELKDAATKSTLDGQGRLLIATDQGAFNNSAANNRGKLSVGVDSVDPRGREGIDLLLGGAGDDLLVGGQTTHAARSSGRTTVADDVIVDGRIITGEDPLSVGKTVRLRFAAVNNAGK